MADDRIVRCRNWMRKIIDAPNVDGWQNMVDTPDDDFTDPDFANDVDISEIKRKDFDNRYPEYVKKVMLTIEKYQGKKISDAEYEEYEERMSKNFRRDTKLTSEKKEKEPEDKTLKEKKTEKNKILKEKESYEEKQERYFKRFEAMQKKYPYLTDTEISEKLRAEDEKVDKDKESYKDNNDLLDEAKKEYERMHGKNLDMQIKQVYKLIIKKGTKFKTALKICKIPDSYEKYVINVLQKLKGKE